MKGAMLAQRRQVKAGNAPELHKIPRGSGVKVTATRTLRVANDTAASLAYQSAETGKNTGLSSNGSKTVSARNPDLSPNNETRGPVCRESSRD